MRARQAVSSFIRALWRARRTGAWRQLSAVGAAGGVLLLFALASCGGSFSVGPGVTQTPGGNPTQTPGPTRFAYLYSRIDYPLQVAVNTGDMVTLTLSPQSNILTVTPSPGQGTGTVGNPIPLPTDLQDYQDIAAAVDTQAVDTQAADTGAFTWALTSPERQTLLSGGGPSAPRDYLDQVVFRWHVEAVAAGQNTVRIVLHLIYVYLDGSEHDGTIEVSQAPVPLVAVQPSGLEIALPQLKLPLIGVSGFAGVIAFLRFLYKAFKAVSDVTGQVKDAAKVAQTVGVRVGGAAAAIQRRQGSAQPMQSAAPWPASSGAPPPPAPPPAWQPPAPPAPHAAPTHADDATWPAPGRVRQAMPPGRPWPPIPANPPQPPRDTNQ
jgi:hypothetical protein